MKINFHFRCQNCEVTMVFFSSRLKFCNDLVDSNQIDSAVLEVLLIYNQCPEILVAPHPDWTLEGWAAGCGGTEPRTWTFWT